MYNRACCVTAPQILATMHKVRQSFIHLMNLPEDTHRHFHHKPLTPNPLSRKPPLTPFDRKLSLDAIRQVCTNTYQAFLLVLCHYFSDQRHSYV